jgi:hypothetical protein
MSNEAGGRGWQIFRGRGFDLHWACEGIPDNAGGTERQMPKRPKLNMRRNNNWVDGGGCWLW